MNGFQNLKQQLLPLMKGLPIVTIIFFGFLFAAKKIINYTPNVYQTIAKIKLDDQKHGMSNNNLFSDFDVFSTENKITAEAEILKSPVLIEKVLDSVKLDVVIFRKGKLKNTMLYNDSPLMVDYKFNDERLFKTVYTVKVTTNSDFELILGDVKSGKKISGVFGTPIILDGGEITVNKNTSFLTERKVDLIGDYEIKIYSKEQLIKYLIEKLDAKAVDKEIAILRVVFKEEHPQKAADFTNALCEAYIKDYVNAKSGAANLALDFIDEKLKEVGKRLKSAEHNLETFKMNNGVVNTTQETETGLREISKLNIQLINLETTERSMQQVLYSINDDSPLDLSAVKFGFGDLLMTELVKKYKNLQDQKHEALLKYKADSENIKLIDTKILEIKNYLKQAIKQNLIDIKIQRGSIELQVTESSRMFENLPTREKNQQVLEREFHLQEEVYNFLSQKKIEASIAASAMISFHRIIQRAEVPTRPVSPNKVLITFVMGLLGLILGVSFIYVKRYMKAKVMTRDDIEKSTSLPILNVIRKSNTDNDFKQLAKTILLKKLATKNQIISVNSTLNEEGKTYVSKYLASAFTNLGHSTCIVKFDANQSEEFKLLKPIKGKVTHYTLTNVDANQMDKLKANFDFVIVDSLPSAVDVTGVEVMALSNLSLYLIRANHTCHNYVSYAEILKEEYHISNIHMVLNDAHVASNYTGNFVGSRFQKADRPKGFVNRVKYYYQTYIS